MPTTVRLLIALAVVLAVPACSGGRDDDDDDDAAGDGDGDGDTDSDADGDTDGDADGDGDGDADSGYNTDDPFEAIRVEAGSYPDQSVADGPVYYRLDLPRNTHAMFEVLFHQSDCDIDMELLDRDGEELQAAVSATDDERLSAWNPFENETFYLKVHRYDGDGSAFELDVIETPLDASAPANCFCDDPDVCQDDCNDLMQLPAPVSEEQGYFPDEEPEYHFMRKSLLQTFLFAVRQVVLEVPETGPLGVTQVGDAEGRIPGVKVGEAWHPQGTHTDGADMDSAYYRTDGPNEGGYICVDERCEVTVEGGCYQSGNHQVDYFCDSDSDHWVDVQRMARYYGHLFEAMTVRGGDAVSLIRVIGADRIVVADIIDAAEALRANDEISEDGYWGIRYGLACDGSYDDCFEAYWAFHVHHTHISSW